MSRHDDELLDDQHDDWIDSTLIYMRDTLKKLTARVDAIETGVRPPAKPTGQPTSRPAALPPSATAAGEAVLAKAVGAFDDGDALLAYADRNVSDVTTIGIISGHIAAGDMQSAKRAVLEHVQRGQTVAKADDMAAVVNTLDGDLASFDSKTAVSELTARFGSMERLLASLDARMAQLEHRPQAAPATVLPSGQNTVAKAATATRRPNITDAPPSSQTKAELLSEVSAYIDSPAHVGKLASMIESGQIREVQAAVTSAKRAHEAQRLVQERKSWS